MIKRRQEIEEALLLHQKTGDYFAFIVPENGFEFWYAVTFLFYQIEPQPKCKYHIEKWKVIHKHITTEDTKTFQDISNAVDYLFMAARDFAYIRALH